MNDYDAPLTQDDLLEILNENYDRIRVFVTLTVEDLIGLDIDSWVDDAIELNDYFYTVELVKGHSITPDGRLVIEINLLMDIPGIRFELSQPDPDDERDSQ